MSFNIRMLNGVGVGITATKKRTIKDGKEFEAYFPKPTYNDPILLQNGENEQTIDALIPYIVTKYIDDTKKIAEVLKQTTIELTSKRIWEFLYTYVQYHVDAPHEEQIRRPARSWADRTAGVDCDCYTAFISSVLLNLRIPHYLRMAAYSKGRGFQHIYVVVPKSANLSVAKRSDYFVIDPVLDKFNDEKPFLFKRDKLVQPVAALNVGVNGFPIRMLNGAPAFDKRSDLVYSDIFFSPELGTWALRGIDGGYYIEGDANKRFVQPLNGPGVGFIDTALRIGGKIGKKVLQSKVVKNIGGKIVGAIFKKRLANQAAANEPSQFAEMPSPSMSQYSPMAQQPAPAPDNTNLLTSVIAEKAKQTNNNTIMSLMAVDKGLKSKIGDFSAVLSSQLNNVVKQSVSNDELTKQTQQIAARSMALLASETQKAEAFRESQARSTLITTISLVVIGGGLLYVATKKK